MARTEKYLFVYSKSLYDREKNENVYFQFFIVNNSKDTILIQRLDAVINNISSSISYTLNVDPSQ